MPKIFISYRREDSEHITGRLYDRLEQRFGRDNVFMDVETIPLGVDFREHLDRAVGRCDTLLAVIGERWLDIRHPEGQRRLDDPGDFVRIEIQAALARGIPVIPVLVGAAMMPGVQDLPEGLKPLAYRNAAEVRSGRDFHDHVDRLARGIEHLAQQGSDADSRQGSGLPRKRLHVLLVDELAFHRRLTAAVLGGEGHTVVTAGSGREAIAAWERETFDLVLMQVQMAGLDGIETSSLIRQRNQDARGCIPIIGMTNDPALRQECLRAGMNSCTSRPATAAELHEVIGRCVGVVDWDRALNNVGGSLDLLRQMASVFLEESPQLMADIRGLIDGKDMNRVKHRAHGLKGMVAAFSAEAAGDAAGRLERAGREGDLAAEGLYTPLAREIERLQATLAGFVNRSGGG
jgi:CheY-like chemotaxis protein